MVLTTNVRFVTGAYDFRGREGLVIGADDIIIDGNGAVLLGGCEPTREKADTLSAEFGYGGNSAANNGPALGFFGTGLGLENRKNVTVRNLTVKGFDQGAILKNCEQINLLHCDFSDCFSDPAWGWDEHGFHGGILMLSSSHCVVRDCRANHVWDALNMRHSHFNHIENNDFAYTSDTGLKLWNACSNRIVKNNFSYGIRIDPGEVHARDSSSVLIESGSNRNYFYQNDMTHGGDGLFIRVLNGWMSTHNVFEDNDCSYANNNAVEAWADHNTYIKNKANYSSYGFWLGNSDHTRLIENEAAYNGGMHHNAPEAFGNCGIAIVNGSGSHSVLQGNFIHDNFGPGIAIRHTAEMPSCHFVIQGNRIENNRDCGRYKGHGIYLKNARLLTFAGNRFLENDGDEICLDGNVADIVRLSGGGQPLPEFSIAYEPRLATAGKGVRFTPDCSPSLRCLWDFGDGATSCGQQPVHVFEKPGLYSVSLTADNGDGAQLASVNLYVLPADFLAFEPFACTAPNVDAALSFAPGIYGTQAVTAEAQKGKAHTLMFRKDMPVQPGTRDTLYAQVRYASDADTDWDRKTRYPLITLQYDEENFVEYRPSGPFMEMLYAKRNEERDNGCLLALPLHGDEAFSAAVTGGGISQGVRSIVFTYGGMSDARSILTVNALGFGTGQTNPECRLDLALGKTESLVASEEMPYSDTKAPVESGSPSHGDQTPRAVFLGDGYYGVVLGVPRYVDHLEAEFYQNSTHTANAHGEALPNSCAVEACTQGQWKEIPGTRQTPPDTGKAVFRFDPVIASGVRVVFSKGQGPASLKRLHIYHDRAVCPLAIATEREEIALDYLEVKLNKELNGNGSPLGDLTASIYSLDEQGKLCSCLYRTMAAKDQIIPYSITRIPVNGLMLWEGGRYALALGQTEEAASRTEGDYYRWIAGKVACEETFGIYTDGETKPTDYDWGTAWLRAVCGGVASEYTHFSDHVGTRFGIRGMQCRYQTFVMPWKNRLLADGKASGAGYFLKAEKKIAVSLSENQAANAMLIYLAKKPSGSITLLDGQGTILSVIKESHMGLNRFSFEKCAGVQLILLAQGDIEICEMELIKE
jgi:parallel beta-helix repeat protein